MLPRAILDVSTLWPNGSTINVTFYRFTSLDTLDVALNAYIAKLISEKIAPYVNLNFVFDLVNDSNAGDIQIGYSSDSNTQIVSIYGNKTGTESLYTKNQQNVVSLYLYKPVIAPSDITFTFGGQTYTTPTLNQDGIPADYFGVSVLHNFCQALGMINEIRNPVGMTQVYDINAIIASFQQQYPNSSITETQLRDFYAPYLQSKLAGSSFDPYSIMNYTTATNSFLITLAGYNTSLSSCDKYWLMSSYPKTTYTLPNDETKYTLRAACQSTTEEQNIGGFSWNSPSSDVFQLTKAGTSVARFDSTGVLTVPSVKLSNPPVATTPGTFLSVANDGTIEVDSSILSFKEDLVGVVNNVINRVNALQNNQTNTFSTLSETVSSNNNISLEKLSLYDQRYSDFSTNVSSVITSFGDQVNTIDQRSTQNRGHIDDLYNTQSVDRSNLARYTDDKTKIVQDDLNEKSSELFSRVTVVENILPPVQEHLSTLTADMNNWTDIQTNTQTLQTQLIGNMATISDRFDKFESMENKFALDIVALNNRITATLDSFQSIQTVITQNYNNLAGNVLPAFAQIELLKQDVTFLKSSSFIVILILAALVVVLVLYVFIKKPLS
jgi:hypothetical protein